MKWKWSAPFVLAGITSLMCIGMTDAKNEPTWNKIPNAKYTVKHTISVPYDSTTQWAINETYLDSKADTLVGKYVGKMLKSQEKLHPLLGQKGYRAAVCAELPGAPVGHHCVYGQYTHLSRALDEMGDTLTIIPQGGRTSCSGFKYHMNKKYNTPEFGNCIRSGMMHESDSAYNAALNKYFASNKVGATASDSVRQVYMEKFSSDNFSADALDAGAILIVPRNHGSNNLFHAIMYVGRGLIKQGKFIADPKGRHVYVGHNRENIGYLFSAYDVSNVFAADTRKIVRAEYAKELKRIESMNTEELIQYLSNKQTSVLELGTHSHESLVRMARNRYFNCLDANKDLSFAKNVAGQIAKSVTVPQMSQLQKLVLDLKKNQKTI
ncbi:MAG: hypothetical protein R8M70_00460 [Alphaproteobacteria bacterium]|nr:hypothetical protein [Alphaproteobacteria bacterium]